MSSGRGQCPTCRDSIGVVMADYVIGEWQSLPRPWKCRECGALADLGKGGYGLVAVEDMRTERSGFPRRIRAMPMKQQMALLDRLTDFATEAEPLDDLTLEQTVERLLQIKACTPAQMDVILRDFLA